jgi:hypothetical protein
MCLLWDDAGISSKVITDGIFITTATTRKQLLNTITHRKPNKSAQLLSIRKHNRVESPDRLG